MGRKLFIHKYQDIISAESLLEAWNEFVKGKRKRKDVQEFQRHLMSYIITIHKELSQKMYTHGGYQPFNISDPKPRSIHKATVRDRLIHHLIYKELYPFFDKVFIADSYSCRFGKGTHRAVSRFEKFARKVSNNHTKTVWVLKCDIKKFFTSIDHKILKKVINLYIKDRDLVSLLNNIIDSFCSISLGKGLPLGNLTSQLLVNVYMNEFDQFVKHELKVKYYIRYADDFVFLSLDKKKLESLLINVQQFLKERLCLSLHPDKVFIKTVASGVDFLGWAIFPDHKIPRGITRRRMIKRVLQTKGKPETVQSYKGLISHGNTYKLSQNIDKLTIPPPL